MSKIVEKRFSYRAKFLREKLCAKWTNSSNAKNDGETKYQATKQ